MFKLLFCCFMNSASEPIEIDIIQPPQQVIAYRPDSTIPFTEKDKQFFNNLNNQYILKKSFEKFNK